MASRLQRHASQSRLRRLRRAALSDLEYLLISSAWRTQLGSIYETTEILRNAFCILCCRTWDTFIHGHKSGFGSDTMVKGHPTRPPSPRRQHRAMQLQKCLTISLSWRTLLVRLFVPRGIRTNSSCIRCSKQRVTDILGNKCGFGSCTVQLLRALLTSRYILTLILQFETITKISLSV